MMGAVHVLPGTTFSNTRVREDYAFESHAIFTLRELERWLAVEIADRYHQRFHATLLRPPIAVWSELQGGVSFDAAKPGKRNAPTAELAAGRFAPPVAAATSPHHTY
jgi:hypothetical protein